MIFSYAESPIGDLLVAKNGDDAVAEIRFAYDGRPAAAPKAWIRNDKALSDVQRAKGWSARVRSYSMNAHVGDGGEQAPKGINGANPDYKQFLSLSDVQQPSNIFVLLDEHPDSINDGWYLPFVIQTPTWIDMPASYHNGAAGFSFADGHSETHRWIDPRTKWPARKGGIQYPVNLRRNERTDYQWIIERMSVKR